MREPKRAEERLFGRWGGSGAVLFAVWVGCAAPAPSSTSNTSRVEPAAPPAEPSVARRGPSVVEPRHVATPHDAGADRAWRPTVSASSVDVAFASIDGRTPRGGRTGNLHAGAPTTAFVILVHAPSAKDTRFQMQNLGLDALFHPHDPAPSVLYVASISTKPLVYPAGRFTHQVDRASAAALTKRFGEFAVLVLDAKGSVRLAASQPASRSALHKAVGHRDRRPGPRARPHPRPRPR